MNTFRILSICVLTLLAVGPLTSPAAAQDPNGASTQTSLAAVMDQARDAYNDERYKEAISLYTSAAQIDPGARSLDGEPYRNIARSHYWLGNYSSATFWYGVYLKTWPKAKDHADVSSEFANADAKRANQDDSVSIEDIYDTPLIELADAIRKRIKNGDDAWTPQSGGTAALYSIAVKRGFAMPELSGWASAIRKKLLSELDSRWQRTKTSPLPRLGVDAEPIDTSSGRLLTLATLSPNTKQRETAASFKALILAWTSFQNQDYTSAAQKFADDSLTRLTYIPYAIALSQFKSGDYSAADKTLSDAIPNAKGDLKPFLSVLHAETLRALDKHQDAAALYLKLLQ